MATTLPTVKVARAEAGQGYTITCSGCTVRLMRPDRYSADLKASQHRRSHGTPDPRDREPA